MNILLTGAAGFVGAHLVPGLLRAHGQAVVFATDLAPCPDTSVARLWAEWDGRIVYRSLDVTDRAAVMAAMEAADPEVVIHAAAVTPAMPVEASQARRIAAVNVDGSFIVLDGSMRTRGIRRVILVSSAAVLGPVKGGDPVAEDAPVDPRTLYATCKLASETIAIRLGGLHGVETVVVRLSGVYGAMERVSASRPNSSPVHRLAQARGVVGIAGADIVRDWVHADDVAACVAALVGAPHLHQTIYHVGGGEAVGWHRLVQAFRAAGRRVDEVDEAEADVSMRAEDARPVLDISAIVGAVGFHPRSIEQGVRDLVRSMGA